MSDLKLILYKDNLNPKTVTLSTKTIYRTFTLLIIAGALFLITLGLATRFYLKSKGPSNESSLPTASDTDQNMGPSQVPTEIVANLRDQIDQLKTQVENANNVIKAPKEIDKKNAALGLFSPNVIDKTQSQNQVMIQKFSYSAGNGKTPTTLTYELHNAHPGQSVEKGYIVVLAKDDNHLLSYPNVVNKSGPYLLDFEKGETFQVARFRMVNATFDLTAKSFQILIFTRNGELLINNSFEAK